jgi:hypothetical protein
MSSCGASVWNPCSTLSIDDYKIGTPREYGALGGTTDDTLAVQAAFDALDFCILDQPYSVTDTVTATKYLTCTGDGELKYTGVATNPVNTVLNLQSSVFGHIRVNANDKEVTCINVANSSTGDTLEYYNINASDSAKNVTVGVALLSGDLKVTRAIGYNLTNTGHVNDSFPQSFVVSGAGTVATIGSHTLTGSRSGLVAAGGGKIICGTSRSVNCEDNGAYVLPDSTAYIGTLYYEGHEEPLVNLGTVVVNEIVAVGSCFATLRVQNAASTYVGTITGKAPEGTAEADLYSNVPTGAYEHRSGNTASGECYIGRVQGTFYQSVIRAGFSSGTTKRLTIGSMDVDLILRDEALDANWNKQNWFNLNDCLSFNLTDVRIDILDINDSLTTAADDYLYSDYPAAVATPSAIENFDVYIRAADGSKSANGVFRGSPQQANLVIQGGKWQTNIGPYMREADYVGAGRDSVTQTPVGGYWFRDQIYSQSAAGATPIWFHRCVASGSPGSWEVLKNAGLDTPYVSGDTAYTFTAAQVGGTIRRPQVITNYVRIPDDTEPFIINGVVSVIQTGVGTLVIDCEAGVTLNGVLNGTTELVGYAAGLPVGVVLTKIGANSWELLGSANEVT